MKTLVIDARMIGPFGHGISKYLEERVVSWSDDDEFSKKILEQMGVETWKKIRVVFLIRKNCPKDSPVRRYEVQEVEVSPYHPLSWFCVPKALKRLKADLFFNPTFASYPWLPCPFVQTVHDLNHLVYGTVLQKWYYLVFLQASIRSASILFTVSETVKQELIEWTGLPEKHFWVTHNLIQEPVPVDEEKKTEVLNRIGVKSKQFFFAIDAEKPHKNIPFLKHEHESYLKKNTNSAWSQAFRSISGIQDFPLIVLKGLSENELSVLYREAAAFCFPSLYEGFGRPPVEAALVGTRVLASDIAVHREAKQWLSKTNPAAAERIEFLKV